MKLVSLHRVKRRTALLFVLLLLSFVLSYFASVQFFGISKDVDQYELFFADLGPGFVTRFEPVFVYFSLAIKSVSDDFSFYIFCLVLVALSIKIFILSHFGYPLFSVLFYLLVLFPLHELTQYRASVALALLYLSFYLRHLGVCRGFAIFIAAASIGFHYSAVAFFPLVLFWSRLCKVRFSWFLAYFAALYLLKGFVVVWVASVNSTVFAVTDASANFLSSRNIVMFLVVLIGAFNFNRLELQYRPWFFVSVYGAVLWLMFTDFPVFSHRLLEMTIFSYLIWVPVLPRHFRHAAIFLLMGLAVYLFYKGLVVDPLFV